MNGRTQDHRVGGSAPTHSFSPSRSERSPAAAPTTLTREPSSLTPRTAATRSMHRGLPSRPPSGRRRRNASICDSVAGTDDAASVCVPLRGCKEGWLVRFRVTQVSVSPFEDRFANVVRDENTTADLRAALRADIRDSDLFVHVGVEPDGGKGEQPSTLRCLATDRDVLSAGGRQTTMGSSRPSRDGRPCAAPAGGRGLSLREFERAVGNESC